MQNRTRQEQLIVRVTPEEKQLIQKKMCLFGTDNFSRYARKMLIDGYVIRLDLSELCMDGVQVNSLAGGAGKKSRSRF